MEQLDTAGTRLGGYVLAGGRSSRMGRDKAFLRLAGQPLVAHAVAKLRRVTGEANILAGESPGDASLRAFGPLVCDAHSGRGPLAGIEAALRHSAHDWNLILPVDVPFVPAAFLAAWVKIVLGRSGGRSPVAMFRVGDIAQPALLLIQRQVAPVISEALAAGEFKLLPVLQRAAAQVTLAEPSVEVATASVLTVEAVVQAGNPLLTEAQRRAQARWFANLNTPEEFADAERHLDALDALD